MALLDTQVAVLANQAMNYLVSGTPPRRLGNAHPNIAPYQTFALAHGHIIVAVGNHGQFRRLCELLGLTSLPDDPRFLGNRDRVAHREALTAALAPPPGAAQERAAQSSAAAGVPPVRFTTSPACSPIRRFSRAGSGSSAAACWRRLAHRHRRVRQVAEAGSPALDAGLPADVSPQ